MLLGLCATKSVKQLSAKTLVVVIEIHSTYWLTNNHSEFSIQSGDRQIKLKRPVSNLAASKTWREKSVEVGYRCSTDLTAFIAEFTGAKAREIN